MENKLPSENYRPEDEYPALDEQPIAAEEPAIPDAQTAEAEEPVTQAEPPEAEADAPEAIADAPQADEAEPEAAPAQQAQPQPDAQPPFAPQNTVPYMAYPVYPTMPGMAPFPQQQGQQMPMGQQIYPQQGMYLPYYYTIYPQPMQQPVQQQMQQPVQPQTQQPLQQPVQPQMFVPPVTPQTGANFNSANPFAAQTTVPDEKKPMSTGTKVFLMVLCALLVAMVAGFIVYIANAPAKDAAKSQKQSDPFSIDSDNSDPFDKMPDTDQLPDSDQPQEFGLLPDSGQDNNSINPQNELKHSEFKEEITLVADDGATQKRSTDNPDSIGKPDKSAKGITLQNAPADADDSKKYTAKSSFKAVTDSVVSISCFNGKVTENIFDVKSSGSGTIISADGYILTSARVLGNSRQYTVNVTLNSGKQYQAKIIGYDAWTDLAVLKIDANGLSAAVFADSDTVKVGDKVIAVGSTGSDKQNDMTEGKVASIDNDSSSDQSVRYIESSAAVDSDAKGGPLCNLCGQVIGVTVNKTSAETNASYAVPSSLVRDVAADLIHYGYIPNRARIGFSGNEIPEQAKQYYNIPAGVIITDISDDGALKGSGVKENDIVTAIDGESVSSFQDIYNVLAKHKVGDKVKLTIYRIEESGFFATETPTEKAK